MYGFTLLLFDADETLFDFRRAERFSLAKALDRRGVACTREIHSAYRTINQELWLAYERGEISRENLQIRRFETLFWRLGLAFDAAAFNADYVEDLSDCPFLLEGAEEVCRQLAKTYRMAIVTNGVSGMQQRRIGASTVAGCFSHVFVSDDMGVQKPMPAFFDIVFQTIPGAERSKTLMIGDSLTADVQGGINAGIRTCWYNPRALASAGGLHPDYEVRDLRQLPALLL